MIFSDINQPHRALFLLYKGTVKLSTDIIDPVKFFVVKTTENLTESFTLFFYGNLRILSISVLSCILSNQFEPVMLVTSQLLPNNFGDRMPATVEHCHFVVVV